MNIQINGDIEKVNGSIVVGMGEVKTSVGVVKGRVIFLPEGAETVLEMGSLVKSGANQGKVRDKESRFFSTGKDAVNTSIGFLSLFLGLGERNSATDKLSKLGF